MDIGTYIENYTLFMYYSDIFTAKRSMTRRPLYGGRKSGKFNHIMNLCTVVFSGEHFLYKYISLNIFLETIAMLLFNNLDFFHANHSFNIEL
jgi:hypothetical protein